MAGYVSAVTLTRTNDTNVYAANDVIGAATGSTAALTFPICQRGPGDYIITTASLLINSTGIISGETSYNLYLYNITPPSALGDNAVFDIPAGDQASYIGKILLGSPADEGSTLYVQTNGILCQFSALSQNVFGYLVTVGTYTPVGQRVYVTTLHAERA